VIQVQELRRRYSVRKRTGHFRYRRTVVEAVRGVTFTVDQGEVVGYLGPNGAGKSTTIKMMTGVLVPSEGRVRVAGLDPVRDRKRLARHIGVMFGQRTQLWWDLPLSQSFRILSEIHGVPAARYRENLDAFRDLLELDPFLDTPVRQLSLGQRLRGELVAVMLHEPEVLFLDEPTIGLDVVVKQRVREFLTMVNRERRVTIVLATHDLSDIERLCSRMLIIDHGLVIYDGTVEELIRRYGRTRTLVVDLEESRGPLEIPGARTERVEGPRQWLTFTRGELTAARLVALVEAQAPLVDLTLEEPNVEEIIRGVYRDAARAHAQSSHTSPRPPDDAGSRNRHGLA
jgi:ABC-2 type transport system ATP-binding protein